MLNKNRRENNKSRGPWGMSNFNFTYRKVGDKVERHRFISAPNEEGAIAQFEAIMKKARTEGVIIGIEQLED